MKEPKCAVIIGGYVNGYSIIQELHEFNTENIVLLYHSNQIGRFTRKAKEKIKIESDKDSLFNALNKLHDRYDKLVLYPTDDLHLENLLALESKINSFCFLPFNPDNLSDASDKATQYSYCEKLGIPFPKTLEINGISSFEKIKSFRLPLIIKPNKREDLKIKVFRSLRIISEDDLEKAQKRIQHFLDKGISFIASEIVPGSSNGTIYAYTCYRSPNSSEIENEWVGKKLTQFPDDYGVFSSASNEAPDIIKAQGRKLIEGMNLTGICEPEFKLDPRDGQYKLMEINLRSMMWHRTGNLSGVHLQYTQWCDAIGLDIPKYEQSTKTVHFSYLKHELLNVLFRKKYWSHFKNNLGHKNSFLALWDKKDPLPFIVDVLLTSLLILKKLLNKILRRSA